MESNRKYVSVMKILVLIYINIINIIRGANLAELFINGQLHIGTPSASTNTQCVMKPLPQ